MSKKSEISQKNTVLNNSKQDKKQHIIKTTFVFNKTNYRLTFLSIGVVILGFILMYGKDDIYSTLKITVAPIIILFGFCIGIYAIMFHKNNEIEQDNEK